MSVSKYIGTLKYLQKCYTAKCSNKNFQPNEIVGCGFYLYVHLVNELWDESFESLLRGMYLLSTLSIVNLKTIVMTVSVDQKSVMSIVKQRKKTFVACWDLDVDLYI